MRTRVLLIANNGMYLTHNGDYFVLAPTVSDKSVFWREGNVIYDQNERMIVFDDGKYLVEVYDEDIQNYGLRRSNLLPIGVVLVIASLILFFAIFWSDHFRDNQEVFSVSMIMAFVLLAIGITLMILSV